MNPYGVTTNGDRPVQRGFRWWRVIVWSVLILVAANVVGILSGLTMARWDIYGATMEEAVVNSRLVRRIAYGVVGLLLYWRLAAPLPSRRWLHVATAFVLVQLLDIAITSILFHASASELFDPGALGRSALAALAGLGLASFGSNSSSKPTPLRGAA